MSASVSIAYFSALFLQSLFPYKFPYSESFERYRRLAVISRQDEIRHSVLCYLDRCNEDSSSEIQTWKNKSPVIFQSGSSKGEVEFRRTTYETVLLCKFKWNWFVVKRIVDLCWVTERVFEISIMLGLTFRWIDVIWVHLMRLIVRKYIWFIHQEVPYQIGQSWNFRHDGRVWKTFTLTS